MFGGHLTIMGKNRKNSLADYRKRYEQLFLTNMSGDNMFKNFGYLYNLESNVTSLPGKKRNY